MQKKNNKYISNWRFRTGTRRTAFNGDYEIGLEFFPAISLLKFDGFLRITVAWLIWAVDFLWEDFNTPPF